MIAYGVNVVLTRVIYSHP